MRVDLMAQDLDEAFRQASGFEWDEAKRQANIEKHGLDFADAVEVFDDAQHFTYTSPVPSEERRYVSVGLVRGLLIAVVSTVRGDRLRVISARPARRNERDRHAK
jgi:uncharacterized DUF497 family protein